MTKTNSQEARFITKSGHFTLPNFTLSSKKQKRQMNSIFKAENFWMCFNETIWLGQVFKEWRPVLMEIRFMILFFLYKQYLWLCEKPPRWIPLVGVSSSSVVYSGHVFAIASLITIHFASNLWHILIESKHLLLVSCACNHCHQKNWRNFKGSKKCCFLKSYVSAAQINLKREVKS